MRRGALSETVTIARRSSDRAHLRATALGTLLARRGPRGAARHIRALRRIPAKESVHADVFAAVRPSILQLVSACTRSPEDTMGFRDSRARGPTLVE